MSVTTIKPANEAEIADTLRDAAEKGTSFEIVSGGTKRAYGRPVAADAILDASAISGILKYEPEELVLTARAGTPLAEIEAALAEKNQTLGFEACDWGPLFGAGAGHATLAGIVAANACGARRVRAGAVRDHVIGCRFVNGRGEAIAAGGHVIKNVTGFDLPKLMCGAFGTLGVLTELTLRVTPAPERVAVLELRDCAAERGLHGLRQAASLAVEPTGLAYFPSEANAYIRVEGTAPAIAEKLRVLQTHFADHAAAIMADDETRALFRDIANGVVFVNRDSDIWRLCVPSSEAYAAVEAANAQLWYADWAGGLLWLGLPASEETAQRLRAIVSRFGGHATLMRGRAEARTRLDVFEPETPTRAGLTREVRAAFDPRHVLNPDRMYRDF